MGVSLELMVEMLVLGQRPRELEYQSGGLVEVIFV